MAEIGIISSSLSYFTREDVLPHQEALVENLRHDKLPTSKQLQVALLKKSASEQKLQKEESRKQILATTQEKGKMHIDCVTPLPHWIKI